MPNYTNFVIVGAGGIGAHLGPILAKYLAYSRPGSRLWIIDGDTVEDKNLARVYSSDAIDSRVYRFQHQSKTRVLI